MSGRSSLKGADCNGHTSLISRGLPSFKLSSISHNCARRPICEYAGQGHRDTASQTSYCKKTNFLDGSKNIVFIPSRKSMRLGGLMPIPTIVLPKVGPDAFATQQTGRLLFARS